MPIHIAEEPLDSVALGSGKCVEEFEALQQVLDARPADDVTLRFRRTRRSPLVRRIVDTRGFRYQMRE